MFIIDPFKTIANYVTYSLAGLEKQSHSAQALHFFIEDTVKILILLAVMITVVSYFRSQFEPEKVRTYLEGKPKALAYILAIFLGAATPFCSCSSIALFIGFIEAGIPFSVTMAFLITSPMINEIAILVLASAIGWKLTIIYIITGMSIGLIGGILMEKLGFERYIEDEVFKMRTENTPNSSCCKNKPQTFPQRLSYALGYMKDIIKKIWIYIVIGIGIGALLHGYVPESFFAAYTGESNPFAVPLAVILGIPLYANATGVIPIAEALLGKGVPIGTVLAMMMSIVAISLPEMIILRKVLKTRMLVYFASYIFISLIIVGYAYNAVF